MTLVKILCNGEDLTDGKGVYISLDTIREIEKENGFSVVILL